MPEGAFHHFLEKSITFCFGIDFGKIFIYIF